MPLLYVQNVGCELYTYNDLTLGAKFYAGKVRLFVNMGRNFSS
jgi:hypothetical protein